MKDFHLSWFTPAWNGCRGLRAPRGVHAFSDNTQIGPQSAILSPHSLGSQKAGDFGFGWVAFVSCGVHYLRGTLRHAHRISRCSRWLSPDWRCAGATTEALAANLTVGAGKQYKTVGAAVAASHDGDTIYVSAGTYVNDGATINKKISIVGVGGMAHFVGSGLIGNGKAFFVTNTDVTFDHIEFSGARVADHNGAGIRYQAGNLTITNSYFHDNQMGILGAANPSGTITIDHSEFARNGVATGFGHIGHNIYIGQIASFTITNSYIHDAIVGHEIKSRAAVTTIENNRIVDGTGNASYSIDLPNSGIAVVKNNLIQQGPNSQNRTIISLR